MKKFLSTLLLVLFLTNPVLALDADTSGWIDNPQNATVNATELEMKSDIKNDFRIYQTTITNITNDVLDVYIPSNETAQVEINKILNSGLSFKDLMVVPKQIAVDSYKEDVGTGNIAKAQKGLIYVVATAGAVIAGAGMLGVYPQQKVEEYFSHKRIRKEYKKISPDLVGNFTLSPLEQKDFLMFVPIENKLPLIKTNSRKDENNIYNEYHQL